jgi:hypothetical protein
VFLRNVGIYLQCYTTSHSEKTVIVVVTARTASTTFSACWLQGRDEMSYTHERSHGFTPKVLEMRQETADS